jgi:hypothetical protein
MYREQLITMGDLNEFRVFFNDLKGIIQFKTSAETMASNPMKSEIKQISPGTYKPSH